MKIVEEFITENAPRDVIRAMMAVALDKANREDER